MAFFLLGTAMIAGTAVALHEEDRRRELKYDQYRYETDENYRKYAQREAQQRREYEHWQFEQRLTHDRMRAEEKQRKKEKKREEKRAKKMKKERKKAAKKGVEYVPEPQYFNNPKQRSLAYFPAAFMDSRPAPSMQAPTPPKKLDSPISPPLAVPPVLKKE